MFDATLILFEWSGGAAMDDKETKFLLAKPRIVEATCATNFSTQNLLLISTQEIRTCKTISIFRPAVFAAELNQRKSRPSIVNFFKKDIGIYENSRE